MGEEPDSWITKNGRRIPIYDNGGKKKSGVVAAVGVFVAVMAVGGGGLGGATSVGGADSAVEQSVQARITSSKNAARKGQYDEAWRRMGLKAIRREVKQDLECALHSFGQVQQFFLRTPCRSLQRMLLPLGDGHGNTIVLSIAWVRMFNASSAERLKQLADTYGTGNVSPIGREILEQRGIRFAGQHYASHRTGSLVVIAEATSGSGWPNAEMLDGAAHVAVEFPPP